MSLATRCPACETVFRVVQDQLKVSEGWVRCGRCEEVFNALQALFDLDPSEALAAATGSSAPYNPGDNPVPSLDAPELTRDKSLFAPEQSELEHTPVDGLDERDRIDFADAQFNTDLLGDGESGTPHGLEEPLPSSLEHDETPAPEFLRDAERRSKWEAPLVQATMALLSVVLLGALIAQGAYHFRNLLAAAVPEARPSLDFLCGWAGCRIEPPQRIDDVLVESSALTSSPTGAAVRLSVVLRNRGPLAVAIPSVELTLTDADGQLMARRALSPADFRTAQTALLPAAETQLQLVFATGSRPPAGYTVEVFYP